MDEITSSEGEAMESTTTDEGAIGTIEAKPASRAPGLKASGSLVLSPEAIAPSIEALLLSVDRPLTAARIAEALGLIRDSDDPAEVAAALPHTPAEADSEPAAEAPSKKRSKKEKPLTPAGLIQQAIDLLNQQYEQTSRAFRIQQVAGGYRVMTLPKFAPVLEAYHGKRERHGVSRAALETLAIIAYKQPLTRANLEAIRGVACGEVLRSLIERRLITIVGRAEELGRPMLYGTTKAFLETFGLSSVKDLPSAEDLRPGGAEDAEHEEV